MSTKIEQADAVLLPASRSVVAPKYKTKYREHAAHAKLPKGTDRKTIGRSNGDWLAVILARETVQKRKSDREKVRAILHANGIDDSRWATLDNGRYRMTGGLALRTIVAEAGVLTLPDGRTETPPRVWCTKYQR